MICSSANASIQPLNVVQEKAKIERASSVKGSGPAAPAFRAPARPQAQMDLIGGDDGPQRPSTTEPISRQPPQKAPAAPPKQTKPGDSLLGLDFLGGAQSAPPERPSSNPAAPNAAPPRTDLKQSILSLYASAPRPAAPAQPQHQPSSSGSFSGFQSPSVQSPSQQSPGGLNDAFSSLNFGATPSPQPAKADPFSSLSGGSSRRQPSASNFGGGGGFFNAPAPKPSAASPPPAQPNQAQRALSQSSGFGDLFSSTSGAHAAPPPTPPKNNMSAGGDLFDLSMPTSAPAPAPPKPASPSINSAFNLSQPSQPAPPPKPQGATPAANLASADPWGSSDVWGSSNATSSQPASKPQATSNGLSNDFGGWGTAPAAKSLPQVTKDDDFGSWSSAPAPSAAPPAPKPSGGGFASSNDPFENPWG